LWVDNQAEETTRFYTSIFRNSKLGRISCYGKAGFEIHGKLEETFMTLEFEIDGQAFMPSTSLTFAAELGMDGPSSSPF